jgi:hypothetical protein
MGDPVPEERLPAVSYVASEVGVVVLSGEVGGDRAVCELFDDGRGFGFHPLTEVRTGRGPLAALCPGSGRCLGVAELALGGVKHAGAILVLALVVAHALDPAVVALAEHGTDFLHT